MMNLWILSYSRQGSCILEPISILRTSDYRMVSADYFCATRSLANYCSTKDS